MAQFRALVPDGATMTDRVRWGMAYVTVYGRQFVNGFWYASVSRILNAVIPSVEWNRAYEAMSARSALERAMTERITGAFLGPNHTSNGYNTPWIPEMIEIRGLSERDGTFVK